MDKNKVKYILSFLAGNIGFYLIGRYRRLENGGDKNKQYCQLYDNWLILKERGCEIAQYFADKNIKEVAVYGYGNIGRHVITQLSKTSIHVKYIIDQRKEGISTGDIACYRITDHLPDVDAVIITPICEYMEIEGKLQSRISAQIISIADIIYELL